MSAGRRALWAWALYDLANTTFSLNVISRYLPLIVVQDLGGRDLDVSIAYSASMLLVAASSPVLGALSDVSGRRVPYLAVTTVGSVAATACMGLRPRAVARRPDHGRGARRDVGRGPRADAAALAARSAR